MRHLLLLVLFAGITSLVSAKIWTVDSGGGLADFTDIIAAISGADEGDTLLIKGSSTAYSTFSLSKKLCLIGPGYYLTENPNPYEYKNNARMGTVYFVAGSSGSQLIGIQASYIKINAGVENVLIKRCLCTTVEISGDNNIIKQSNMITGGGAHAILCSGTGNTIRNNYIKDTENNYISAGNIVENNIISTSNLTITSSTFGNNIILTGNLTFNSTDPYNCICNASQCGTESGNQANVVMADVFVETGTSDGTWMLKVASPALGAGLGGVDCGMFGGLDPYVLSGIPDIPMITSIVVPSRANPTDGLDIKVTIQSNN